jgi:gamma-glutamylputrescine oxidase
MSVSYWDNTKYGWNFDDSCDVLIIGAGLAGRSTRYWLNKLDPEIKTITVDKGHLGSGASGRNAGFITCGSTEHFSRMTSAYGEGKAEKIWKFTEYNHQLIVEEFGRKFLERECEYRNLGSWTLAATEHEIEVIGQTVNALNDKGVNVEWREHAFDGAEGFHGGAYYKDDGEIHPVKYMRNALNASGDPIWTNEEVFSIETKDDCLLVRTNSHNIKAQSIVLCTNAWSSQLFPWFKDKISPMRGQIIVTEPVAPFLQPSYCSFVLDYFRQLVDGSVLIGGFRNADVEREVGYSDEINPRINEKLEGFLNEHFPILRNKRILHRWSGVMGFAADGYPMVGALDEDPRIFYNAGFTAHGLGFTFATGELTAKLILEGQDPGIFSGRRFA